MRLYTTYYKDTSTGATGQKWFELTVEDNLSLDSTLARLSLSILNLKIRAECHFSRYAAPSNNYPISIHCQLAPPLFTV